MSPLSSARAYLRVSKDASGHARSVAQQMQDLDADAHGRGWTKYAPYKDVDVSASRYVHTTRGAYDDLVRDLQDGAFDADVLMLWEGSRGSRRVGEWVALLDLLEQRHVHVWVSTDATLYRADVPAHRKALLTKAVEAEHESGQLSSRVKRSKRAAAAEGRPLGRLLYGYTREYDERGQFVRQIPHPEQAPIVQEVNRRFAAGEPLYQLARELNSRQVPSSSGSQWKASMVRRLVTRPAYAGLQVHQGQIVGQGGWDPIVDPDTWQACQARIEGGQSRRMGETKLRHFLTGVISCGVCDSSLHSMHAKRGIFYICPGKSCTAIKVHRAEEFVTELLLARLQQSDVLLHNPDDRTAQTRQELDDLKARLDEFHTLAAQGQLSGAGLIAIERQLLPQIEQAQLRLQAQFSSPVARNLATADADIRPAWDGLGAAQRREVARTLLSSLVLHRVPSRGKRWPMHERLSWQWRT